MIYVIGFLIGTLNGLFASGAGQFLVFYLIFILKKETHIARALSVSILSISSIFAVFGYSNFVISGIIGAKLMKKIPANILNLISGILIVGLTIYKMIQGG